MSRILSATLALSMLPTLAVAAPEAEAGIPFGTLVWLVAAGALAMTVVFFVAGKLWQEDTWDEKLSTGQRVRKSVFGVLAGIALFVLLGAFTVMRPESKIEWVKEEAAAKTQATKEGKPLFIDFWAEWCARCNEIEGQTFSRPEFLAEMEGFVPFKADVTKDDSLMDPWGVENLPTLILSSADGKRKKVLTPEALGKSDATEIIVKEMKAFSAGVTTKESKGAFAAALQQGLIWALLAAFLGGLATSLTPCVFPMIPVTAGIIGQSAGGNQVLAFRNSLIYVAGMALCYSTLGVTVALVGGKFSALFQNAAFLIAIGIFYLAFGAHMLGIRRIKALNRIEAQAGQASHKAHGLFGLLLIGVLAGFIFAPCVGPVLLGVLAYIGQTQDVMLGFVFMLTFALGMGLPFVLLGTFSGLAAKARGKGGAWVVGVEAFFGSALVGAALYFLIPIAPPLSAVFKALASLAG